MKATFLIEIDTGRYNVGPTELDAVMRDAAQAIGDALRDNGIARPKVHWTLAPSRETIAQALREGRIEEALRS